MFDATLGRFLQRDAIRYVVRAINPYLYARDAPSNFLDPTGREDFSNWNELDDDSLRMKLTVFEIGLDENTENVTQDNVRDLFEIAEKHTGKDIRTYARGILASHHARKLLLEYVRRKLTPIPAPVQRYCPCIPGPVNQLIQALESPKFEVRMKATADLEKYNRGLVSVLQTYLTEQKPCLELIRRLEQIIDRVEARYRATGSQQTMLDVLLQVGAVNLEVRRVLESIAGGWEDADVTRLARDELHGAKPKNFGKTGLWLRGQVLVD